MGVGGVGVGAILAWFEMTVFNLGGNFGATLLAMYPMWI